MKKATIATVKSFIKKNADNLLINVTSSFDGMTDCCESRNDGFSKAVPSRNDGVFVSQDDRTFGIRGAWFVGQSRDYIQPFEQHGLNGFVVSNSCGRFILAIEN